MKHAHLARSMGRNSLELDQSMIENPGVERHRVKTLFIYPRSADCNAIFS